MKILKYFFFLILILIIGSAIYFGTKEGDYAISDSLVVNAPPAVVFNKVNDFKNWETWGPWKKEDASITFTYAEKTAGEGASYSWEGEMDGSMTNTKVIQNKEIEQDLMLKTPAGERNPKIVWTFEEVEDGTKVTWLMKGRHTLIDKMYYSISGYDFDTNIHTMQQDGLEGIAEEAAIDMKKYKVNVDGITQYGGGFYMYNSAVSKLDEIPQKMEPMIQQVMNFIEQNNLNMTGPPFTIYNSVDKMNNTGIFSVCVPVRDRVITPENSPVVCGFLEAGSAVKITLKGNYKHVSEAYDQGIAYVQKNNLEINPKEKMFEVYVTDPKKIANPAEWITEVYIPIMVKDSPLEDQQI